MDMAPLESHCPTVTAIVRRPTVTPTRPDGLKRRLCERIGPYSSMLQGTQVTQREPLQDHRRLTPVRLEGELW